MVTRGQDMQTRRTRTGLYVALLLLLLLAGGMVVFTHDKSMPDIRRDVPPSARLSSTHAAQRVTAAVGVGGQRDWQLIGPTVITHAFVSNPAHPSQLYEGTVAGVYRSTDAGRHWQQASLGLSGAAREVWSLIVIPDGSLVAATGGGVYRSSDGARHWRAAGLAQRAIYTLAAHLAGRIVLLAGGDGGIFRSDDRGLHWRTVYDAGVEAVSALAWPAARPSLVVAGLNPGPRPVAISLDGGGTWRREGHGLPARVGLMSIAVAPGARVVYAGSMGLGAYVAAGPLTAWRARTRGLLGLTTGDAHIGSFAFDPDNPAIIYAATPNGVYRSPDAGIHWALFGHGLRGDAQVVTALSLVMGPRPTLYAATIAGVYRQTLPLRGRRSMDGGGETDMPSSYPATRRIPRLDGYVPQSTSERIYGRARPR